MIKVFLCTIRRDDQQNPFRQNLPNHLQHDLRAFSDFNASHGNLFGEKALRADLSIKILREEYRQAYNKSRLFDKR